MLFRVSQLRAVHQSIRAGRPRSSRFRYGAKVQVAKPTVRPVSRFLMIMVYPPDVVICRPRRQWQVWIFDTWSGG